MAQTATKLTNEKATVFLDILGQLERVDSEFPLNYTICLTHIAMNEGMSLTQLSEKTGLALSTISRIVGALSTYRQNGQGYELIEQKISPQERRRKELYLTQKGWAVIRGVSAVLDRFKATGA